MCCGGMGTQNEGIGVENENGSVAVAEEEVEESDSDIVVLRAVTVVGVDGHLRSAAAASDERKGQVWADGLPWDSDDFDVVQAGNDDIDHHGHRHRDYGCEKFGLAKRHS